MRPLLFFFFMSQTLFSKQLQVDVQAEGAILINAESGVVLFEKNAFKEFHPASITKIATALFALKKKGGDLSEVVEARQEALVSMSEEAKRKSNYSVPSYWLVPGGTHIGIKKGEELFLSDLIHGMMIASGNDAANVIATHVSGSVPKFMEELNVYLKELGCQNTTLYNPHGLHHPEHQSSPYDMALIAREAMKDPFFRQVVSSVKYQRPKTNKQEATTLLQSNKLLRQGAHYNPKAIGIKTGYIANAQHTFVGAAEHEGRTLIAVLMKTKVRDDIFKDTNKLFEKAFAEEKVRRTFLKEGLQTYETVVPEGARVLKTVLNEDLMYEYYPAEEEKVRCTLYWDPKIRAPIAAGEKVARVVLETVSGRHLKTVPLFARESVDLALSAKLKRAMPTGKSFFQGLGLMGLVACGLFFRRSVRA